MRKTRTIATALAAVLLLASCASEDDASPDRSDGAAEGTQDMDAMNGMDMNGMPGMRGRSTEMMAGVQAHMEMMRGMSGDSLQGMLAGHRQMAANMIAQMNREMRDMNMPADASWNATMDSLRADLTAMPEMDPGELQAMLPGHHRRALRLMEMHREMMAGMHD